MKIELAKRYDRDALATYDTHISASRRDACIRDELVYVLRDGGKVVGILRYNLFWQTIPFLDLLYLDSDYRGRGYGTAMMTHWESEMRARGYQYVMTSTQADETAWRFYEKCGYIKNGSFLPPEQEADEWLYLKILGGQGT